jgi:hypothetical protein
MNEPPTAQESMEIACRFMEIVDTLQDGTDAAADALTDYLGEDPETGTLRAWYLASCGPLIASAALKSLNKGEPFKGGFWGLVQIPGSPLGSEPSQLAMMRSLTAYLNEDAEAATDVIAAHHATHGIEGLFGMICAALILTAFLKKEGAFA